MGRKRSEIYGWGINDSDYKVRWFDTYGKEQMCPFFRTWKEMVRRCHSERSLEKNPSYIGCVVDIRWKNFMSFREWMIEQDWRGKELDKDVLHPLNQLYSPETCAFIDSRVNRFIQSRPKGALPVGVYLSGNKFSAKSGDGNGNQAYLGLFDTKEEAHNAWREYKNERAIEYASQQTDERVKKALLEWYTENGYYKIRDDNKRVT